MLDKPIHSLTQPTDSGSFIAALPKHISLYGRLEDFDLLGVIQMFCIGMHSGWLTIVGDKQLGKGRVAFQNGLIIYATTDAVVKFGTRLVKKELLTSQQLSEALKAQKDEKGKRSLGAVLIEKGWVTQEHLQEELRDQTVFVVKTLLKWRQGYFYYEYQNNIDSRNQESTEGFDSDYLLLEVGQMFDEDSDRQQDNQFLVDELPEQERDPLSFSPGAQPITSMFNFPNSGTVQQSQVPQEKSQPAKEAQKESAEGQDSKSEEEATAARRPTTNVLSWLADARKTELAYLKKTKTRRMENGASTDTKKMIRDRHSKDNS
jgi:hypothetical protein